MLLPGERIQAFQQSFCEACPLIDRQFQRFCFEIVEVHDTHRTARPGGCPASPATPEERGYGLPSPGAEATVPEPPGMGGSSLESQERSPANVGQAPMR